MGIETLANHTIYNTNTTNGSVLTDANDDYDYLDYNWTFPNDFFDQNGEQPIFEVALKCVFYAIAMFFAVFGNLAIIIVVIRTKSLRTKFNIYIVNLAVADFFIPIVSMWLHLGNNLHEQWAFGSGLCKIHTFIQVTVVCASILTLSILTVDRYLSTVQSRYAWLTQKFQIATIVVIWICSTGIASPWIIFTVYKEFDWLGGHEIICQAHFPSTRSRKVYYVTFFGLCYAIPLAVIFSFVISTLVKSNNRTSAISSDVFNDVYIHHETKRKAVYLLLTVLVVFCICWTPQQSLLLWDIFRDRNEKPAGVEELHYIALFMAYSTSAINPVVYFVYNKYFRHAFYYICKTKCKGEDRETAISPDVERQTDSTPTEETTNSSPEPCDPGPSHVTIPMTNLRPQNEEDVTSVSSSD